MSGEEGHATPEEAALAEWPPGSGAQVLRTEQLDSLHVDVVIDTVPSHPMRVHCYKIDEVWYCGGDIVE